MKALWKFNITKYLFSYIVASIIKSGRLDLVSATIKGDIS